jgi:hypothetical protein
MKNGGLMKKIGLILVSIGVLLSGCQKEQKLFEKSKFPDLHGAYLGQTPPGLEPEIFAAGIISTGMYERDVAISPDGKEFFYGLAFGNLVTIMVTRLENGLWTEPQIAPFAKELDYFYFEPCISPDGKRLLFLSTRPQQGQEAKPGWGHQNIWAVDRREDGNWSEPYDLGSPINTENNEYFPSVTQDSTLYFTRSSPGEGKAEIFRSRYIAGKYAEPEPLPTTVNGQRSLYNAYVAPDESYLIACVEVRNDSVSPGLTNYCVYFRKHDDTWSDGIDLGEKINTLGSRAFSPYVSLDGKYFFFASARPKLNHYSGLQKITWTYIQNIYNAPQNGSSDIYWVDAQLIQALRPDGFE